jgi:hypothetical protein
MSDQELLQRITEHNNWLKDNIDYILKGSTPALLELKQKIEEEVNKRINQRTKR